MFADYLGPVAIRLWDGRVINAAPDTTCTVIINDPGVLREAILYRDALRLGEAFLDGAMDIEGDIEALFQLGPWLENHRPPLLQRMAWILRVLRWPFGEKTHRARSPRAPRAVGEDSRASIAHHYDVSNDFYHLLLDPEMVYSCAYFCDRGQNLAAAQEDKLDYLCRKLRLSPGEELLDIGCGWGALVLWAARHYGVRAHGITPSEQQYRLAQERIQKAGLEKQVRVDMLDYSELSEQARYDRVVSVGMFEHVGVKRFHEYFETVRRVLKPGGLFLNHCICNRTGWLKTPVPRFINQYVFPGGELARIGDVIAAMEGAGFEILDVESLRRHYALTLRHWIRSLEAGRDKAIDLVGEIRYRVWRLYMAGSAYFFDNGELNVFQVLAGHATAPAPLPLRRDDLYRNGQALKNG